MTKNKTFLQNLSFYHTISSKIHFHAHLNNFCFQNFQQSEFVRAWQSSILGTIYIKNIKCISACKINYSHQICFLSLSKSHLYKKYAVSHFAIHRDLAWSGQSEGCSNSKLFPRFFMVPLLEALITGITTLTTETTLR